MPEFYFFPCCLCHFADLTKGSLPSIHEQDTKEVVSPIQYVEIQVKHGDTLLSLIESQGLSLEQISIEQMVEDFVKLNDGLYPEQMRPGEVYKIPIYETGSEE